MLPPGAYRSVHRIEPHFSLMILAPSLEYALNRELARLRRLISDHVNFARARRSLPGFESAGCVACIDAGRIRRNWSLGRDQYGQVPVEVTDRTLIDEERLFASDFPDCVLCTVRHRPGFDAIVAAS
jgi:hypothetical protein